MIFECCILLAALTVGETVVPQGANVAPNGDRLDVTSKCLRLNGRALVPVMGEMHYSRVPRGENLVCDVSALRLVKPAGTPPPVRIGPAGVAMPPDESAWEAAAAYEVPVKPGANMLEIGYEGDMARLYADGVLVQDDFWKGLPIRYALRRLPKGTKRLVLKVLPRGAGWENKIYIDRARAGSSADDIARYEAVGELARDPAEKPVDAPKDMKLVLCMGQSNMAGRAKMSDADRKVVPRAYTLDRDGRWVAAALADKNISPSGHCPVRVIVDSLARTPLDSKVVTDGKAPTIIAVAPAAPAEKIAALRKAGAEVLMVPADPKVSEEEAASKVNLTRLMEMLGDKSRGITSVLVEGGGTLAFSLLKAGLMDKVHAFVAPMLIGGQEAKGALGGEGFERLIDSPKLKDVMTEMVGKDIHITGYI